MQLYLLRHADADTPATIDDDRALSDKGVAQTHKVATFCETHELRPQLILTSPIRRALETAQIVTAQLRCEQRTADFLACGMRADAAVGELKAYERFASMMLVGHEPDFSQLAAHLLGLPAQVNIHIRKASLTLLQLDTFQAGTARLEFSIPCKLL
jgi:phosphohistidine phosphatase